MAENQGVPFKYFISQAATNFTYSAPVPYWGWDPTGFAGYTYASPQQTCNAGVGFYELQASTADGLNYQFSYTLKTLPSANYLNAPEGSTSGGSTGRITRPPRRGATLPPTAKPPGRPT